MAEDLIDLMQRWVATVALGASSLRNQGAKGVLGAAREHLASMNLKQFATPNEKRFRRALECETERLRRALPQGAQNWGPARKALNLFLRDAFYNYDLRTHFLLTNAELLYEVALDSYVAGELKKQAPWRALPRWPGLKNLTSDVSGKHQEFASALAEKEGVARVHLDAKLWLKRRARRALS